MTTQIPHFINGKRTAGQSTRTADVMDPNTGQVQAVVPMASVADVDAAVAVAVEAQKEWAAWNPQRRARVMMRFVDLVNKNADELAEKLSLEHGKTVEDSRGDIPRACAVTTPGTSGPCPLYSAPASSAASGAFASASSRSSGGCNWSARSAVAPVAMPAVGGTPVVSICWTSSA